MKTFQLLILLSFLTVNTSICQSLEYYELRTYHCSSQDQIDRLDHYLENVFIPLLKDHGLREIGVFKDLNNDTSSHKKMFVFIPAKELQLLEQINDWMVVDIESPGIGRAYLHASHDDPAYDRIETSWLRAFTDMPKMAHPSLKGNASDRVFELRSYEGATERLYRRKVDMFNAGGEIKLFESLAFNAVFYAEVLTGSRMPNLIYMTSFDDMTARNKHWEVFRSSPIWEELKGQEKYQNTVSRADIYLLESATYSTIR